MTGMGTVVELRVHGVSGTPPEALLGCPTEFIEQVAGDKSAGFHRRREWIDTASYTDADGDTIAPDAPRWRRVMEAYSWGGLTSGPASRALWLLFLPFIFINLAHWMLPPAANKRGAAAVSVALLRLLALSFTLTLMLAAAVAVMDVIVWQCLTLDHCASALGPFSGMASIPRGAQVALSAIPLVVVIVVLWLLGKEGTRNKDEDEDKDDGKPTSPHPAVMVSEVPFEHKTFWRADDSVLRMRSCHVMAWAAGLAAVTLAVPINYAGSTTVRSISIAGLVANGLVLAVAVAATAWNNATARGGDSADNLTKPLLVALCFSLVSLAASLIWVAVADVDYPRSLTQFPALPWAIYVLLAVQVALLVALFVFTALSLRQRRGDKRSSDAGDGWRPTLCGFTAPFVALLAWLLGCGFSVGVGLGTAELLGKVVVTAKEALYRIGKRTFTLKSPFDPFETKAAALNSEAPLIVPPPYLWAAVAVAVVIVAAIMTGVCVWWWTTRKRAEYELDFGDAKRPGTGSVISDYGRKATEMNDGRACEIARSRAWAYLTDLGPRIVASLALFTVVAVVVVAVLYLADFREFRFFTGYESWLSTGSVFIAVALPAGLALLTVQAYRNRQLRRVVGVLWDIATFWPRANHPLTPPCYAERTVPELLRRIKFLVDQDNIVVLAAHSQGTVIAAATLLLADEDKNLCGLLTFGSPLRRLYARNFPAYFGTRALPRLCERQRPRWINLWALSDPIGAWVNDGDLELGDRDLALERALQHVDVRLPDTEGLEKKPDHTYPPICGHSGFWNRREYTEAVNVLDSTLTPTEVKTDTSATAPPTAQYM
jgi:hypothetical protein